MTTKGAAHTNKRLENHLRMQLLRKKLMSNPKWRNQKGIVIAKYNGGQLAVSVIDSTDTFEAHILTKEDFNHPGEVIEVKPDKKRLTVEEKLALSKKLAGSSKLFSNKGVEDAIKIANRDYDREEEE